MILIGNMLSLLSSFYQMNKMSVWFRMGELKIKANIETILFALNSYLGLSTML